MAVVGVLAALLERSRSGRGQVVEIDMVRSALSASLPASRAQSPPASSR